MPNNHGPITPDRQRRFEAARRALEQMCPGHRRTLGDWIDAKSFEVAPLDLERARWLLVVMGRARGTEGGAAVARLAERGYSVASKPHLLCQHPGLVVPLDTRCVVFLGLMLPVQPLGWRARETLARATPLEALTPRRWCTAHESLEVCAALSAEGHDLGVGAASHGSQGDGLPQDLCGPLSL